MKKRPEDEGEVAQGVDTGDYSATLAPENREHIESTAVTNDESLNPRGASGARADVGIAGLDRDTVPSGATSTGQTRDGAEPSTERRNSRRE